MVSPISQQPFLEETPYQAQGNLKQSSNIRGKWMERSISLLGDLIKYTGITALVTAIGSLWLCQNEDSNTKQVKLSYCLGSCYIFAELTLIIAALSYFALQIFLRMQHNLI